MKFLMQLCTLIKRTEHQIYYTTYSYCTVLMLLTGTCTQKLFLYVKGTQFRSPLHQHSEKKVHQI